MSVDFYPAIVTLDAFRAEDTRPALWCACELLEDQTTPDGGIATCVACLARVNMNNVNAADVLRYLGIESAPYGKIRADELADLCRAAIADTSRARPRFGVITGRVIQCGRDAEYLPRQARALLVVATYARGGWVAWA